ncbi:unnamed protein product [Discula destructiva]
MDPTTAYDPLIAGITFSGSLLSFLATTVVLICFVYYREEQQSFRHALVFNLALAEWMNTLNNTISGSIYLRDHALYPGTACTLNGFFGQLSVQAADFSILLIAVVTLVTITRTAFLPFASNTKKVAICLSVWVIPIITATVATSIGVMGPVSGNWCWIMATRSDLRYALTHGWRIGIIVCTTGIYLFVWWFMHRHFKTLVMSTDASSREGTWSSKRRGFKKMKNEAVDVEQSEDTELGLVSKSRISRVVGDEWELSAPEAAYVGDNAGAEVALEDGRPRRARFRSDSIKSLSDASVPGEDKHPRACVRIVANEHAGVGAYSKRASYKRSRSGTMESEFPAGANSGPRRSAQMEREIKRVLLLNAYPIMYVVLWIPGLTNRIMEASGNRSDSRALAALQASSQFVGLANALTYGFNAALRKHVRRWWKAKKRAFGWTKEEKLDGRIPRACGQRG